MSPFKRVQALMTSRVYRRKLDTRKTIIDSIQIILGILSATLGLKGFLLPNGFIDGGVVGISLLVAQLSNWELSTLIVIFNLPFIFLGYKQVGKAFTLKTIAAIGGLALCLYFADFKIVTDDKLLISVFGGFFLGAGIGLSVRGGSVIDGTEILALYISKRSAITIGGVILSINILIFACAALLLGIEPALYSLLAYLSASRTVDFIVHGIEEYTGLTIISTHSEEIRVMITEKLGRGVTIYKGKGGYRKIDDTKNKEIDVLFTVASNLEVPRLRREIEMIDPKAFLVMNTVNDTRGGVMRRRRHH
jgi:uncharacterized membrane-anchored protein YitT (DUF2179 family)